MNGTSAITKGEAAFAPARRVNQALTASIERRALQWMAQHVPSCVSSDALTILGLSAQIGAGICYAFLRDHRYILLLACLCLVLNWFGDSMDGTLARIRKQERPRYGFYVDHMMDVFGSIALIVGLAYSGLLHWQTAVAMLLAFLVLSSETYLATYTLSTFQLSHGVFGPTEIRILLIVGNLVVLRSPYSTVLGHRLLLFDIGGTVATACMFLLTVSVTARHTLQLYRQEPLS